MHEASKSVPTRGNPDSEKHESHVLSPMWMLHLNFFLIKIFKLEYPQQSENSEPWGTSRELYNVDGEKGEIDGTGRAKLAGEQEAG